MVLPLFTFLYISYGALAHLGERLPCKQEVAGSSPAGSTKEKFSIGSSRLYLLVIIVKNQFRFGLIPFSFPLYNETKTKMEWCVTPRSLNSFARRSASYGPIY